MRESLAAQSGYDVAEKQSREEARPNKLDKHNIQLFQDDEDEEKYGARLRRSPEWRQIQILRQEFVKRFVQAAVTWKLLHKEFVLFLTDNLRVTVSGESKNHMILVREQVLTQIRKTLGFNPTMIPEGNQNASLEHVARSFCRASGLHTVDSVRPLEGYTTNIIKTVHKEWKKVLCMNTISFCANVCYVIISSNGAGLTVVANGWFVVSEYPRRDGESIEKWRRAH